MRVRFYKSKLNLANNSQDGNIFKRMQKILVAKAPAFIFALLLRKCRVGQGVKTPPFHGGITGSNPVRGTKTG
jgi:hypothetical protein